MANCKKCGAPIEDSAELCANCAAQEAAPEPQPVQQQATNPGIPEPVNALQANWKTSVGMTILGVVLMSIISGLPRLFPSSSLISALLLIAGLVYALAIYPTYFSKDPKSVKAGTVSLLNGLFGGIIFGCLWNSNITKRKQGKSYIVYAVFAGLSLLSLARRFFTMFMVS